MGSLKKIQPNWSIRLAAAIANISIYKYRYEQKALLHTGLPTKNETVKMT